MNSGRMEENVSRERKKLNRLKFCPKGDKIISKPIKQKKLRIGRCKKLHQKSKENGIMNEMLMNTAEEAESGLRKPGRSGWNEADSYIYTIAKTEEG